MDASAVCREDQCGEVGNGESGGCHRPRRIGLRRAVGTLWQVFTGLTICRYLILETSGLFGTRTSRNYFSAQRRNLKLRLECNARKAVWSGVRSVFAIRANANP